MNAQQLQTRQIEAWTYLLRQEVEMAAVRVVDVTAEPISSNATRYWLTLAGHPEPITLVGKESTAAEIHFYQEYAAHMDSMAPRVWFSELLGAEGWLVLDDTPQDHAPNRWTMRDMERLVEHLALLHGRFWGHEMVEERLPHYIGRAATAGSSTNSPAAVDPTAKKKSIYRRQTRWRRTRALPASYFSVDLAQMGSQAAALMRATVGLQILRGLGGWPGVLEEKHLDAFEHLLEEPALMLNPLRELPFTLLHGRPAIENWRISLFDQYTLLDWKTATLGPSVCDLVYLIEDFFVNNTSPDPADKRPYYFFQEWAVVEETLVDSYFIALGQQVAAESYNARTLRRHALPAARCLYAMTTWLPTIADWFIHLPPSRHTWEMIHEMDESQLATLGYTPLLARQPHLRHLFGRFFDAYLLLQM